MNFSAYEVGLPDIQIFTGRIAASNDNCRIVDEKYYIKHDYIYCGENGYKFAKWAVELNGFERQQTVIRISPNLAAELVIQGDIVGPLIFYQLGRKGVSVVHGSALSRDGKGVVLAGRSAVGKTTLALHMVMRGYKFLGDNFSIIRKGEILAYLSLIGVFSYNLTPFVKRRLGIRRRLILALKGMLYKMTGGYIKIFTQINPDEMFRGSLAESAPLSKFILLLQGREFHVSSIGIEDLVQHLVLNQRMDCLRFDEYSLAYAYEFPDSNLARCWETYERNLFVNIPRGIEMLKVEVPGRFDHQVVDQLEELIED